MKTDYIIPGKTPVYDWLASVRLFAQANDLSEGVDVRIQLLPGHNWQGWEGDPQFDTDHRGIWSEGTVNSDDTNDDLRATMQWMIDELEEGTHTDAWEASDD